MGTNERLTPREQYGNNLGRKPSQTILNRRCSNVFGINRIRLILSHLDPLVGALKRPTSAVRSRLWPSGSSMYYLDLVSCLQPGKPSMPMGMTRNTVGL